MANDDNGNGFRPVISPFDGCGGQPKPVYMLLADANSEIGLGSPVTITSGRVDLAAAGAALCGVAAEHKSASNGTSVKIAVWANPAQLFTAQTDNGTGTLTAVADIGLNTNHVGTGVSNKRSTAELDEDAANTTATLSFKTVRLSEEYGTAGLNAFGEFNRIVVKINNHQLLAGTGTAGS